VYSLRQLDSGKLHNVPESYIGSSGIWDFPVNPQSHNENQPVRVAVKPVASGTLVDTAGTGQKTFSLNMSFGTKRLMINSRPMTPQQVIDDLRVFLAHFIQIRDTQRREGLVKTELVLDDALHNNHWFVIPKELPGLNHTSREAMQPKIDLTLIGVRPYVGAEELDVSFQGSINPANDSRLEAILSPFVLAVG
jgi:hypothetical protein